MDFIEGRTKIWKEHMEKIMNKENEWDQMVETGVVARSVEKVTGKKTVKATQKMKSGKANKPSK